MDHEGIVKLRKMRPADPQDIAIGALGASRRNIATDALGQSARACGLGIAAGLAIYVAAARPLGTIVFEVAVVDPFSIATFTAVLAAAVLAATWPAARRAARTDPAITLRAE